MSIYRTLFSIPFLLCLSSLVNSYILPHRVSRADVQILDARDSCGKYICYYGSSAGYPGSSQWMSFDQMFGVNKNNIQNSCRNLGIGSDDVTDSQINMIRKAILDEASYSHVDSRWILAIIMQESIGCPSVGTTANPVAFSPSNPGLMQSAGGTSFVGNRASAKDQENSIQQMIADGVRGTSKGNGLLQWLSQRAENFYEAARMYNSGYSGSFDNLNNGGVGTAAYVNDIANRLTGPYVDTHFSQC